MKVKELIEWLQTEDQEAEVVMSSQLLQGAKAP